MRFWQKLSNLRKITATFFFKGTVGSGVRGEEIIKCLNFIVLKHVF